MLKYSSQKETKLMRKQQVACFSFLFSNQEVSVSSSTKELKIQNNFKYT